MNLEKAVQDHSFRPDLYYRINVIQIVIPPLRERGEDIPPLAMRLLSFFGRHNHRSSQYFTDEAMLALREHTWPGNVRELRNVVERASILCQTEELGPNIYRRNWPGRNNAQQPGDLVHSNNSKKCI